MEPASCPATTQGKVTKYRHHQRTSNRHISDCISVQSLVAALDQPSHLVLTCQFCPPTPAQLTTPGCDAAREYLVRSAQAVAALAAARPDLQVEVNVAPVSGTVSMSFVGCNLTNTYRHLHNVALSLTPVAATHRKGLLIVAVGAATTQIVIPRPCAFWLCC